MFLKLFVSIPINFLGEVGSRQQAVYPTEVPSLAQATVGCEWQYWRQNSEHRLYVPMVQERMLWEVHTQDVCTQPLY